MRDRHRPAFADLFAEQRYHAAVAAQHIAETYDGKARSRRTVHLLHQAFGDPLRRAHHACGIDRFIRRDQHKTLDPGRQRGLGHNTCPKDIVPDGLARIVLHQWHMLMGRRMKNQLRRILGQYLTDSL